MIVRRCDSVIRLHTNMHAHLWHKHATPLHGILKSSSLSFEMILKYLIYGFMVEHYIFCGLHILTVLRISGEHANDNKVELMCTKRLIWFGVWGYDTIVSTLSGSPLKVFRHVRFHMRVLLCAREPRLEMEAQPLACLIPYLSCKLTFCWPFRCMFARQRIVRQFRLHLFTWRSTFVCVRRPDIFYWTILLFYWSRLWIRQQNSRKRRFCAACLLPLAPGEPCALSAM